MKLKYIVLTLLITIIVRSNYMFLYNYSTLNNDQWNSYADSSASVFPFLLFVITCISLSLFLILIISINWNKTITLNSILKTIKSIKLN